MKTATAEAGIAAKWRCLEHTDLHGMVLVLPKAAEETTAGGLLKPDSAKQRQQEATIVIVSPNDPDLKIDDLVLTTRYGGTDVEQDGVKYLLLERRQIYLIGN